MDKFEYWDKAFRQQNLFVFNGKIEGLLWLKVRAVSRGKQIEKFLRDNSLTLKSTKISEQNRELFYLMLDTTGAMEMLDKYLRVKSHNWYDAMGIDEKQLKEDLYRLQNYAWGGGQNNSLDKHLVSRYVKVISRWDELVSRQAEIAENA